MTNEERDIISQFIARVGGAPAASGFSQGGSVPTTQVAALPPVDRDADALIGQMFQRYPEAAYRMTQLAFVQEQGLIQAQNRVQQLEAQLAQAQRASQQQAHAPQGGGGFFSSPTTKSSEPDRNLLSSTSSWLNRLRFRVEKNSVTLACDIVTLRVLLWLL